MIVGIPEAQPKTPSPAPSGDNRPLSPHVDPEVKTANEDQPAEEAKTDTVITMEDQPGEETNPDAVAEEAIKDGERVVSPNPLSRG